MALEFSSRKETFPNYRKYETTFAGRPFVVETGKLSEAQRRKMATWLKTTYLNGLFTGQAVFRPKE